MDPQVPPATPKKRRRGVELENIIKALDVKPKDYEAAWNNLKARLTEAYTPGHAPTLAPASLGSIDKALKLFGLREVNTALFTDVKVFPIPPHLEAGIARIHAVTNGGSENEAFSRTILDQILISSLYEESKQFKDDEDTSNPSHAHPSSTSDTNTQDTTRQEDPAELELLHEMPFSKLVTYEGQTRLLTRSADYSIWYDNASKKTLATNPLFVEAKRRYQTDASLPQLVAYMGIVHATRTEESKQNCVVYGIASDGRDFRFCRINNDGGFVSTRLLQWVWDKDKIYSIMRSLIRAAALSSPSTTPIKDPMRRKIILASFGSPQHSQKIDFGLEEFEVFEADDEECDFIKI